MQIIKKFNDHELLDVLAGARWEVQVDANHGMVALVDVMPRLVPTGHTADYAIAQAARTSFGLGMKTPKEDRGLIRYLMRHAHTTPLEMVEFKFHHVLPIFVARQLIRHRTANVNEFSLRYAEVKDRFWFPQATELRAQSKTNKQGGDEGMDLAAAKFFLEDLAHSQQNSLDVYQAAVGAGMAKELARTIIPVSVYTEWYWKIDLHNLLHFLSLRQDKHAQKEIRDYAEAMYLLIKDILPVTVEAYDDYDHRRGGMKLTALDLKAMRMGLDWEKAQQQKQALAEIFENTRELTEFRDKMHRIGNAYLMSMADAVLSEREPAKS
jgi:thymidylate synthase (FAD)